MASGPKGHKSPADFIGNAFAVRVATGEETDRRVSKDTQSAAYKFKVLIVGWIGLLFASWFALGVFLGGYSGGLLWTAIIGFLWAVAYWPVTLIVIGLGLWASIWWMKHE